MGNNSKSLKYYFGGYNDTKKKRLGPKRKDLVPNFKFKSSPSPRSQLPSSGLLFFISKMGLIVSTSWDCCEDLMNQYIQHFHATPSRTSHDWYDAGFQTHVEVSCQECPEFPFLCLPSRCYS